MADQSDRDAAENFAAWREDFKTPGEVEQLAEAFAAHGLAAEHRGRRAMNLWLITQSVNNGYDTYDCAVVAAATSDEACAIHPTGEVFGSITYKPRSYWHSVFSDWVSSPDQVEATHIGTTDLPAGTVVCASFNSG
jgi:hypothetical protein